MSTHLTQREQNRETAREASFLEGKTCVVTGSSRGIGRAIATTLGSAGANVVVNYCNSAAAAHDVADQIEAEDGQASVVQADVAEYEAVLSMAETVHDRFGQIDVLVNNAGITADGRFDRLSPEEWHRVIDVNLGGAFHCTKAFYDDILAADAGRVVNVSSVIGQRGNYGQTNYAASKSGLVGFTRSLARELAAHDATANCVSPGYTRTEMVESVREDIQDSIREDIPLDRFAEPEEIAAAVRFLASDDASYLTGEVINVNGGMYG
jgi:3-oxoacyl-[acyl-carrier protein] reductase